MKKIHHNDDRQITHNHSHAYELICRERKKKGDVYRLRWKRRSWAADIPPKIHTAPSFPVHSLPQAASLAILCSPLPPLLNIKTLLDIPHPCVCLYTLTVNKKRTETYLKSRGVRGEEETNKL